MTLLPLATPPRAFIGLLLGFVCAALVVRPLSASDEDRAHANEPEPGTTFSVEDFQRFGVRLAAAAPGEVDVGVDLPGEVRPNADRIAHIAPRFPGLVREVRKYVGDHVRAGEVLAIVESENLSPFELKAAFEGTIIDKHIAPGEAVTREQPAFIVADLTAVWVNLTVYQAALPQVRVGQPVVITAGSGDLETTGTVTYITPVVDQATRTASARVVVSNEAGTWRPGLFVTAAVLSPVPAAIVIPKRAIQTFDGKPAVFVVAGDRFEPRPVTLGRSGRTQAEITRGLSAGERFADQRSFLVKAEFAKGTAGHED